MQDSEPFCRFCLLLRYCTVFQVTHSPCLSALFRLHSSFVPETIKRTALFSICFHRLLRYYGCVGLPAILLDSLRISLFWFPYLFCGNVRISAVPISYLSSTSPSSQTGGCHYNLAIPVITVLSAVIESTSTISNLIIISQLNHFTFVSALLLPVLRLNLMLPFRLQGLGTGGWLDLTW